MDRDRLRYSRHARTRLVQRDLDEDDIETIVKWPSRRTVTARAVEHDGWVWDGLHIKVVTDRSETFVITIVDFKHRRRDRRYTR